MSFRPLRWVVPVACGLATCTGPAAPPPPDGTLTVLGRDAAQVARVQEDDQLTALWRYPFRGGERRVTERWRHDPDGGLIAWSRRDAQDRGRSLEVGPDGAARWAVDEGDLRREGTWQLPERPRTWAGPLPEPGAWSWWDGERVVPAQVTRDGVERQVHTADGRRWRLSGPPERREVVFPDHSALRAAVRDIEPWEPREALALAGPAHPAPRKVRALDARWQDHTIARRRPLGPEIPKVPRAGEPPAPGLWTLPLHPDPIDLRITAADDRLLTVTRALALVRRLATPRGQSGLPRAATTLAQGGDCDDLATLLVAGLAHEQIPAEIVRGWLLTEHATWVRHAWVRVPMAAPVPWLAVDPALGQLPADAARLADDDLPPGARPDQLVDMILR